MVISIGTCVSLIFRTYFNVYFKRLFTCNRDEISSQDETHHRGMKNICLQVILLWDETRISPGTDVLSL